ncbi:uncharacterized protein LOC129754270 [Uranotaenia lowii]|uniref:uncharacterized protein LOC129754270 n=1 Tax=Uranotaenia lowii TaxID=190385 RepID=UPI002478E791|nr:uncharacterized protein LOC129754270 [Uranotaenia lowii]
MAYKFTIYFLVMCLCLRMSLAMPSYEDDRIELEKDQHARQARYLLAEPSFSPNVNAKRQSEIINTILGLPRDIDKMGYDQPYPPRRPPWYKEGDKPKRTLLQNPLFKE